MLVDHCKTAARRCRSVSQALVRNVYRGQLTTFRIAGEVFEGRHHGSAVAVKVLELNDEKMMMDACQEFGFLHGLRHSKLVISYGACVDVRFPVCSTHGALCSLHSKPTSHSILHAR